MKKIMILSLMTCLGFFLVACGGNGESEDLKDGKSEEVTEVVFWHSMDSVYGELVEKQVDKFNATVGKEKKISVKPVFQGYPGTDALTAAMSSDDVKNMPDVIQLYGESISIVRDYDRTVWAEDYIESDSSELKKDDLIPNTVSSFSIEDKLIGVPYNIASWLLYYNKTHFENAGITDVPKTIAEMAEIIPALVEENGTDIGLNAPINQFELINFIVTQGKEFGNNDNGHSGYMTEFSAGDNGALEDFLNEWKKVVDTGYYKPFNDSINEEFGAGLNSMVIMSSSRIQTIEKLVDGKFDWDVAEVPMVSADDKGGSFPTGGGLIMLDRDDQAKIDATWEFIQFVTSADIQSMWLEETGYVPVNVKVTDTEEYQNKITEFPILEKPYNILKNSDMDVSVAYTPDFKEVNDIIRDSMIEFGQGNATVEDTLAEIIEGVKADFEEFYRINPID